MNNMGITQPFKKRDDDYIIGMPKNLKNLLNNKYCDIITIDYNPSTDRQKYKYIPFLKKTIYVGGGVLNGLRKKLNSVNTGNLTPDEVGIINSMRLTKNLPIMTKEELQSAIDRLESSMGTQSNTTTERRTTARSKKNKVDMSPKAFWDRIKKNQTFGIELEMSDINTREAKKIFKKLGLEKWKAEHDSSISGRETAEVVTPPLKYDDLPKVEKFIEEANRLGAKSGSSVGAGMHIHIGARNPGNEYTPKQMRNVMNLMNQNELLIAKGIGVSNRMGGIGKNWCQKMDKNTIKEVNQKSNVTFDDIKKAFYQGESAREHYNPARYHALNLDSYFNEDGREPGRSKNHGTMEFRMGQFGDSDRDTKMDFNHLKAQVEMVTALAQYAKDVDDVGAKDKYNIKLDFEERGDSPEKIRERNQTRYGLMSNLLDKLNIVGEEHKKTREYFLRKFKFD